MILHFWYSASEEQKLAHALQPVHCLVNGTVQRYSYCNANRYCQLPPGLRNAPDLQYLGQGTITEPPNG